MFPLPFRTPTDTTQAQFPTNAEFLQPYHHVRMQPAAKGSILPRAAKDIPYPSTDGDVQIAKRRLEDTLPDYVTACSKARRSVRADPRWTSEQKETGDDILVTTLGTGSISLIWEESCSTPGKEHLVSCDAGLDPKESLSYTANFG